MTITPAPIVGLYTIDIEPIRDHRGFFARTWSSAALTNMGLSSVVSECSMSANACKNTVRGLHFQSAPNAEVKVVRCTRGSIFDVVVDIRPASPTFLKTFSLELSAENARALYIPTGFAHGFQTLENQTEVTYFISTPYRAESARTIRWDDPTLAIPWPSLDDAILSASDANAARASEVLGATP